MSCVRSKEAENKSEVGGADGKSQSIAVCARFYSLRLSAFLQPI